jgi:hypothetical protein
VIALSAVWPLFRRWAGSCGSAWVWRRWSLVPIFTQSGEALQERVKDSSLISRHADLAEGLLPWIFVLFVVSGVLLWWNRAERTGSRRALRDGSPSCWP